WIPSVAPSAAPSTTSETVKPAVAAVAEHVVTIHSRKAVRVEARVNPEPAEIIAPKPEPQPVSLDALAAFRPPAPVPVPSDGNVSVLFVGVENGEWLRWLAARHG